MGLLKGGKVMESEQRVGLTPPGKSFFQEKTTRGGKPGQARTILKKGTDGRTGDQITGEGKILEELRRSI